MSNQNSRLSTPITKEQLSLPIAHSHHYDNMERAMYAVFVALMQKMVVPLDNIHHYGTPYLGSRQVVEAFTKLNGLAMLRRRTDAQSDKIMAIILQNYLALASERGVAFLKFVLDMLYPDQSELVQLWHDKSNINEYPAWVYDEQSPERFLTSRLRIYMKDSVDAAELGEVAPVFRKLVPWHIVPEIAFRMDAKVNDLGMVVVFQTLTVFDFSPEINGSWA
ncbi:MAG: hypothetical protein Q4B81_00185 [Moraxella sp.]|nr:hypothetical protein [Moraxella sp.]